MTLEESTELAQAASGLKGKEPAELEGVSPLSLPVPLSGPAAGDGRMRSNQKKMIMDEEDAGELLGGLKLWSKKAGDWLKDHYEEFKHNLAVTLEGVEDVLFSPPSPAPGTAIATAGPPVILRRKTESSREEGEPLEVKEDLDSSEEEQEVEEAASDSDASVTSSTSSTSLASNSSSSSSSSSSEKLDFQEERDEPQAEEEEEEVATDTPDPEKDGKKAEQEGDDEDEKRGEKTEHQEERTQRFLVESESDDSWCNIDAETDDTTPTIESTTST